MSDVTNKMRVDIVNLLSSRRGEVMKAADIAEALSLSLHSVRNIAEHLSSSGAIRRMEVHRRAVSYYMPSEEVLQAEKEAWQLLQRKKVMAPRKDMALVLAKVRAEREAYKSIG